MVGADDFCEVRDATASYKVDIRFPTGYPDQQALADYLKRRRTDFIEWVDTSAFARTAPYELDVIGKPYRSGDPQTGTRSVVLTIGDDTGVHPVTTFKAFNYNLATRSPVTLDTLFKPGFNPSTALNPLVWQQVRKRDPQAAAAVNSLTAASYQQFAITDDEIIFFFNQDGFLPHQDGPLQVAVPRTDLASVLK